MSIGFAPQRFSLVSFIPSQQPPVLGSAVLQGLSASPKQLSPLFFYDETGSKWFEEICKLPEYYLTRTEHDLLSRYAGQIAGYSRGNMSLVEFGSGSSMKTRVLIEALISRQGYVHYVPVDISISMLKESCSQLLLRYPQIHVSAHATDYKTALPRIGKFDRRQKMILFLGSNIGNLDLSEAVEFLRGIQEQLQDGDYLLLGTDLKKDPRILEAAYNDAQGVTAQFNFNLLRRINRELEGDFKVEKFSHVAFYSPMHSRIEMHLRSEQPQVAWIGKLQRSFHFKAGETIHTENSYKFSAEQLASLFSRSGLKLVSQWLDQEYPYALNLLTHGRSHVY